MFIQITFTEPVETNQLVPSPKDIADQILSRLDADSNVVDFVTSYFTRVIPNFYVPDNNEENYVIRFHTKVSALNQKAIDESIAKQTTFMGHKATWTLLEEPVTLNCFPYKNGIEVEGVNGPLFYLLNEDYPRAQVTFKAPQRLTLNVDCSSPIKGDDGLKLTNAIHKYIVKNIHYNHQCIGHVGNQPISPKERLRFSWITSDKNITKIVINCSSGISDEIVEFFYSNPVGIFFKEQTTVAFSIDTNEYITETAYTHFETLTNAFPCFRPKGIGKDSVNAQFFKSFQNNAGIKHLEVIDRQYIDENSMVFNVKDFGKVMIKVRMISSDTVIRGGRFNDSACYVEIETETPVVLHTIGTSGNFGAGLLKGRN